MELPKEVRDKQKELNKKTTHSVHIKTVKSRYYAYEYSSVYNKDLGKWESIALYLGKINNDGTLTKPKRRVSNRTDVDSLDELIQNNSKYNSADNSERLIPDEIDLKILEKISTDGRATISEISKYTKISRSKIKRRLHRLETRYKIKYTVDFAPRPFGLFRFYALIKFRNNVPEADAMKRVFDKYPLIQVVAFLKGDYDMFIYFLADNTAYLEDMIYDIRRHKVFVDYGADWTVSYIMQSYGFIPFRDRFFDNLRSKIWDKNKETLRKPKNVLLEREFNVLFELNKNGRSDFKSIDVKYNMSPGSAQYTYYKLLEKKIIRRITITAESLPLKYSALIITNQIEMSIFDKEKRNLFKYILEDTGKITNRFVLLGDIGAPYGMLSIMPVFDDLDIQKTETSFYNLFGANIESKTVIIIRLLIGNLGFRRMDNKESVQYKLLHGTKYEETDIYP